MAKMPKNTVEENSIGKINYFGRKCIVNCEKRIGENISNYCKYLKKKRYNALKNHY